MKKVLFSIVLVLASLSANAANWISQGAGVDSVKASYIDTSSLLWTDYSYTTRSAWLKIVDRKGFSTIQRYFVHCPSRMVATTEVYYYDSNGSYINTETYNGVWEHALPNSMADKWGRTICATTATTK